MAWAASGTAGAANDSSAGSTWGVWGGILSVAGERLLLVIATDNIQTTDGNSNNHTSITGSTDGETWTKLREFTNGQGGAAAGATVSVWISSPILDTSTPTITVNFSGSITKKAAVWVGFTTGAGATVSSVGTPQDLANDGADPGSMTLGSLPNAEHLWIRAIAAESNTDTGITNTASWTTPLAAQGTQASTTGGGSAGNMAAAMEYRILTGTTATSDPTWTSADCASILLALDETGVAVYVPRHPGINHQNPGIL